MSDSDQSVGADRHYVLSNLIGLFFMPRRIIKNQGRLLKAGPGYNYG